MKRRIVSTLLAAAMVAALCLSLTACGETSISLNDYMTITFSGDNGNGTASAEFDYEKFEADYEGKVKYTEEAEESHYVSTPENFLALMVAGPGELSADSGLSNGDEVTYFWNFSDDYEEYIKSIIDGVNLKYSDITTTVIGLEEN